MDIRSQNTGAWLPQNSLYIRQINVYLVPGKDIIDDFEPGVIKLMAWILEVVKLTFRDE